MGIFCLENQFFNCLKKSKFSEICLENSILFCKIAGKMEIFRKFACRNRIFLPGSTGALHKAENQKAENQKAESQKAENQQAEKE